MVCAVLRKKRTCVRTWRAPPGPPLLINCTRLQFKMRQRTQTVVILGLEWDDLERALLVHASGGQGSHADENIGRKTMVRKTPRSKEHCSH